MLKNNIEVDVKIKCIEAGKTQAQLGEMIGSTGQYVNRGYSDARQKYKSVSDGR